MLFALFTVESESSRWSQRSSSPGCPQLSIAGPAVGSHGGTDPALPPLGSGTWGSEVRIVLTQAAPYDEGHSCSVAKLENACLCELRQPPPRGELGSPALLFLAFLGGRLVGPKHVWVQGPLTGAACGDWAGAEGSEALGLMVGQAGAGLKEAGAACPPAERQHADSQSGPRETAAFLKLAPVTGLLVRAGGAPRWPRNGGPKPQACRGPSRGR